MKTVVLWVTQVGRDFLGNYNGYGAREQTAQWLDHDVRVTTACLIPWQPPHFISEL